MSRWILNTILHYLIHSDHIDGIRLKICIKIDKIINLHISQKKHIYRNDVQTTFDITICKLRYIES